MQEKEAEQVQELEEAKQAAKEATQAFDEVRTKRHEAFMAAFTHISGCIDRIFKVRLHLPVAVILPMLVVQGCCAASLSSHSACKPLYQRGAVITLASTRCVADQPCQSMCHKVQICV